MFCTSFVSELRVCRFLACAKDWLNVWKDWNTLLLLFFYHFAPKIAICLMFTILFALDVDPNIRLLAWCSTTELSMSSPRLPGCPWQILASLRFSFKIMCAELSEIIDVKAKS